MWRILAKTKKLGKTRVYFARKNGKFDQNRARIWPKKKSGSKLNFEMWKSRIISLKIMRINRVVKRVTFKAKGIFENSKFLKGRYLR
jgi:hypothetical protein